jgi:hypothetical protein
VLGPAKTPRDVIAKLRDHEGIADAGDPAVNAVELLPMSSAEFDTRIRKEIEASGALAKAAGIKSNRTAVPLNYLLAFRVREVWPPRSGLFGLPPDNLADKHIRALRRADGQDRHAATS